MSLTGIPMFWRETGLRSIGHRSLPVRIIWDWNCHGGRLRKFAPNVSDAEVAGQCPICRGRDSQRHWIMDCTHPGSLRLRRACTQAINDYFSAFEKKENLFAIGLLGIIPGQEETLAALLKTTCRILLLLRILLTLKYLLFLYTSQNLP